MSVENVNCVHSLQFDCFIHVILLEGREESFQEVDEVPVYFFLVLHNLNKFPSTSHLVKRGFFFSSSAHSH